MKTLFDPVESELEREKGMQLAAEKRELALETARLFAKSLASFNGTVTADDVQRRLEVWGLEPLGNAAGSIFKGKEWECIGWKKSERVSNHARSIRVWKLKG